jgi:mannose-6-phosphate isomerase-like protein (cupin superfamily)
LANQVSHQHLNQSKPNRTLKKIPPPPPNPIPTTMSQFITTHNTSGQAVFSSNISEEQHELPLPFGGMRIIYTAPSLPTNLNTEADIDQYSHIRTTGLPNGAICPPGGSAAAILSLAPGAESPMHRTVTMDWAVILEGEVELILDGGETRKLRVGDSVVMRGTMHQWINRSGEGKWARMGAFAQDIVPVEIGGRELGMEFIV